MYKLHISKTESEKKNQKKLFFLKKNYTYLIKIPLGSWSNCVEVLNSLKKTLMKIFQVKD